MARDWAVIEKQVAELWCRAKWCENKARPLVWRVCADAKMRYQQGDHSPSITKGRRDYDCLINYVTERRSIIRHGRANWYCMDHTREIDATGQLSCTVAECGKKVDSGMGYCSSHYQYWYKHGTTERMHQMRLPCAPAILAVESRGGYQEVIHDQTLRQRLMRALRCEEGILLKDADELAVAMGTHPAIIWGDAWWDKTAMECSA